MGLRGSVWLVLGLLALGLGAYAVGHGIADAIGQSRAIRSDAVARGVASDDPGAPIPFESRERHLTVYLDFKGVTSNSERYDDATGATVCTIAEPSGTQEIRGSRQGTAATLGSLSSVGSFDLEGSSGRIACAYDRFAGRFRRPDRVPFLVTPHGTGDVAKAVLLAIGGVFGAVAGVLALLRSRRRSR